MSSIVTLQQASLSFGGPTIFDKIDLQINSGERIGLLGRNGMGKSTLLKVINSEYKIDSGVLSVSQGVIISSLEQEVLSHTQGTVFSVVAEGLAEVGNLLLQYHQLSLTLNTHYDDNQLAKLHALQEQLESRNGWRLQQQIETIISRLSLDPELDFSQLSGGTKRRVLLAKALVSEPDLLLLDEPTNHLDLESITWLEQFLLEFRGAILFITHDRKFLQNVANRIIELDRGKLTDYPGNYAKYLETKLHFLEIEKRQNDLFDKKLAQEEVWIRQGVKARRTRNEGRVRALESLRQQRSQRRGLTGTAKIQLHQTELSGKLVVEAKSISYKLNDKAIIKHFSTSIIRGDKIGIIGPNGCGKTTLIKLLLGQLIPSSGDVKLGTKLEIAYFDQLREQLDDRLSIQDNVGQGSDFVTINEQRKHIIGYLQDFLFSPAQARAPVSALSGGERNRVLLAKLFTKAANVIVLDEPTNDLDIETLEILESLLVEYTGTVILVSHDRAFLNNVVTSTIVYCGDGQFQEFVGGYDDYLWQTTNISPSPSSNKKQSSDIKVSGTKPDQQLRKELAALPAKINKLEHEVKALQTEMLSADFYQQPAEKITAVTTQVQNLEKKIQELYRRWEDLETQIE